MAFSNDQPFRKLGPCRYCGRSLNQPFCTSVDPSYHQTWRAVQVSINLSAIQESINLIQFLQKCETDYVYAVEGHESPFNQPTFQKEEL